MTLTPSTRASLLLRLRDPQDHEAWVEFVAIYEPVTYRLLRRHGLQDADARDVMQELFHGGQPEHRPLGPGEGTRLVSRLAAACGTQSRHQLAEAARTARRVRSAAPICKRCWTCCPLTRGPGKLPSSIRSCAVPCFSGRPSRCAADVHPATWKRFGRPASLERRPRMPPKKLGMAVGAIRVAKCRVLARLRAAVTELEKEHEQSMFESASGSSVGGESAGRR